MNLLTSNTFFFVKLLKFYLEDKSKNMNLQLYHMLDKLRHLNMWDILEYEKCMFRITV